MNKVQVTFRAEINQEDLELTGDVNCGVLDGALVINEVSGQVDKTYRSTIVPLDMVEKAVFDMNSKEESKVEAA